ncbi:type II secretion system F family protein [Pseudonocardia abyssalis]|uniref:Type II secretion system F family protein n=1 Tax=Pseudonocardia abyssalis TaxID=2792008 RepID=A0ABS6UXD1_9PSEU|nr:type II secretion system F family protein [Pseudonocardia abyssalis]MBW0114940.1 type II secretion system F family protein [Pseudonocardia abyssalis]MBW0136925.1 type II secretion system F family protein [Pseudonocardia abyssalis]
MTPPVLLLLAAALLVGGPRVGAARLNATPRAGVGAPAALRPAWIAVGTVAGGAAGLALGGPVAGAVSLLGSLGALVVLRRLPSRVSPPDLATLAAGWELLGVCLRAGLPVASAVAAAAGPLPGPTGVELRRVAGLLELGADPADAWQAAQDVPVLAVFARAAGRSAGTGAALAQVAVAEAARVRAELVDTAQARAQRAGVLITGPLGLCFLPAFLVLGIAPVVIGLAGQALARW